VITVRPPPGAAAHFRGEVKRLQKDADPGVRAAALHVERDACEIEMIEVGLDRASEQGWRYKRCRLGG
jgi:hypothetical protein